VGQSTQIDWPPPFGCCQPSPEDSRRSGTTAPPSGELRRVGLRRTPALGSDRVLGGSPHGLGEPASFTRKDSCGSTMPTRFAGRWSGARLSSVRWLMRVTSHPVVLSNGPRTANCALSAALPLPAPPERRRQGFRLKHVFTPAGPPSDTECCHPVSSDSFAWRPQLRGFVPFA